MATDESQKQKRVIEESRNKDRQVHFASLMDLCHLKNSELEPQFQKYSGRVVLPDHTQYFLNKGLQHLK